jgi:hypothetical protein
MSAERGVWIGTRKEEENTSERDIRAVLSYFHLWTATRNAGPEGGTGSAQQSFEDPTTDPTYSL